MNITKTAPSAPKTPAPGTVAERVRATVDRLHLDEARAADYLGVPVFTLRKWLTGEREPGAAVARLLDVLGMVEALAPALHDSFLPAPAAPRAPRRRGRPKNFDSKIGHVKKSDVVTSTEDLKS